MSLKMNFKLTTVIISFAIFNLAMGDLFYQDLLESDFVDLEIESTPASVDKTNYIRLLDEENITRLKVLTYH